jgi:hypothetical protein
MSITLKTGWLHKKKQRKKIPPLSLGSFAVHSLFAPSLSFFPFSFLNFINGVLGRLRTTSLQGEIHRNWYKI